MEQVSDRILCAMPKGLKHFQSLVIDMLVATIQHDLDNDKLLNLHLRRRYESNCHVKLLIAPSCNNKKASAISL